MHEKLEGVKELEALDSAGKACSRPLCSASVYELSAIRYQLRIKNYFTPSTLISLVVTFWLTGIS